MLGMKYKRKTFLIAVFNFLFVFVSFRGISQEGLQNNIILSLEDSIKVHALIDSAKKYKLQDFDKSRAFVNKAHQLSASINYQEGIARSISFRGQIQFIQELYDSSMICFEQTLSIYQNLGEKKQIVLTKNYIAHIKLARGEPDLALEVFLENEKDLARLKDTLNLSIVYSNIGNTFAFTEKYEKALEYFIKSNDLWDKVANPEDNIEGITNVGSCLAYIGRFEESLEYFKKALFYAKKGRSDFLLAEFLSNIGGIYAYMGKNDSAIFYMEEGLNYAKRTNDRSTIVQSLANMGEVYLSLGQLQKSEQSYRRVLEVVEETVQKDLFLQQVERGAYYGLFQVYNAQKLYENALEAHIHFSNLTDSITKQKNLQVVQELEAQFESEKKDEEIKLLNEKEKLAQAQIDNHKIRQRFLITVIGSALIALTFILLAYSKNKKLNGLLTKRTNSLYEALEENKLLMKEMHHRVKNNLQMISSLLNLQSKQEKSSEVIHALEAGKNRVKSVALIHEKLYQNKGLSEVNFKEYVTSLSNQIIEISGKSKEVKLNIDVREDVLMKARMVILIGLILNELITNSLKYAFNGAVEKGIINIKLIQEGENSKIVYEDNGPGIAKDFDLLKSKSLGIKLIHMLVKQMNGTLQQEDAQFMVSFNSQYLIHEED